MLHIVFFKLNQRTEENQDTLVSILNSMQGKVPMVKHMEVRKDFLGSARSYDVALLVTLEKEDLEAYANDPYHCACKEKFAPLIEGTVVVDAE